MNKEECKLLEELISHRGWSIIDDWLKEVDKRLNNALRNYIAVPGRDESKWLYYYSGQASVTDGLRKFIKMSIEKNYRPKIKKKDIMS